MTRKKKARGKTGAVPMALRPSDEAWLMARVIELGRELEALTVRLANLEHRVAQLSIREVKR